MKIKPNELRIGNFVAYGINPVPIKSIHTESVLKDETTVYIELNDKLKNYCINISEIEPIQLTEYLLLRCGFEKKDEHNLILKCQNLFSLNAIKRHNDTYTIHLLGYQNKKLGKSIEYFHELQNLYFALTGFELEIRSSI